MRLERWNGVKVDEDSRDDRVQKILKDLREQTPKARKKGGFSYILGGEALTIVFVNDDDSVDIWDCDVYRADRNVKL